MPSYVDLSGQRFGKLLVVRDVGRYNKGALWQCICDCGKVTNVPACSLRTKKTTSCGCYGIAQRRKACTKHGMHNSSTYTSWENMIDRCLNTHCKNYKHYGGRGIKVCKEWRDFTNFFRDMGVKPKGMQIDRINNDGDYCKENCRWVTGKQNLRNTSRNINITYKGQTKCLGEWCEVLGLKYEAIYRKYYRKNVRNPELLFAE